MGSAILTYNRHTLAVVKHEIALCGRHLDQFLGGEEFWKLWPPFPPPGERGVGAQDSRDSEIFVLVPSTQELCVALIKSPGPSEHRPLFSLTRAQR